MKFIFFCGGVICTLAACTWPTSPGKHTAECYVRYMAQEAQLLAEATLKKQIPETGAYQAVEVPEGIRYRGNAMTVVPVQGIAYQFQQTGGYHPEHTFEWADPQGKARVFTLQMPAIPRFWFEPETISRQQPATLHWEGESLQEGESLVLMWETTDRKNTVPMEITGTPGQRSIAFPAAQLAKLDSGRWTLYLVRKKRFKDVQEQVSMLGLTEFYSTVDTLQVQ